MNEKTELKARLLKFVKDLPAHVQRHVVTAFRKKSLLEFHSTKRYTIDNMQLSEIA